MKKLFFLLLSCVVFGQNIELLQKLQNGDQTTPTFLAEKMLPEYKLVHTYKLDSRFGDEIYYVYLPKNTSENIINEYKNGGINGNEVKLSYIENNSSYVFSKAIGNCDVLFPFWKKEIQPDPKAKKGRLNDYTYEDSEYKIKYYFLPTDYTQSKCSFTNMYRYN